MIGIYCIINKANNKRYIGQTSISFNKRKNEHFYDLNNNRHHNIHLQNSFNKYGEDAFYFEIIDESDENELDILERFYIKKYDTMKPEKGYNKESGGYNNKTRSDEIKLKISETSKGRVISKKTREKISKNHANFKGKNSPIWGTSKIETFGGMEFLKNCIEQGMTQREIGEIVGLAPNTIADYLKLRNTSWNELTKNNPKYQRRGKRTSKWGTSILEEYGGVEFIKDCIIKGMTQEDIAKIIKKDRKVIGSYLKCRNLSWSDLKKELLDK